MSESTSNQNKDKRASGPVLLLNSSHASIIVPMGCVDYNKRGAAVKAMRVVNILPGLNPRISGADWDIIKEDPHVAELLKSESERLVVLPSVGHIDPHAVRSVFSYTSSEDALTFWEDRERRPHIQEMVTKEIEKRARKADKADEARKKAI